MKIPKGGGRVPQAMGEIRILAIRQRGEVSCVRCLSEDLRCLSQLFVCHPAVAESDFFEAGHFESLMVFDGADELRGF